MLRKKHKVKKVMETVYSILLHKINSKNNLVFVTFDIVELLKIKNFNKVQVIGKFTLPGDSADIYNDFIYKTAIDNIKSKFYNINKFLVSSSPYAYIGYNNYNNATVFGITFTYKINDIVKKTFFNILENDKKSKNNKKQASKILTYNSIKDLLAIKDFKAFRKQLNIYGGLKKLLNDGLEDVANSLFDDKEKSKIFKNKIRNDILNKFITDFGFHSIDNHYKMMLLDHAFQKLSNDVQFINYDLKLYINYNYDLIKFKNEDFPKTYNFNNQRPFIILISIINNLILLNKNFSMNYQLELEKINKVVNLNEFIYMLNFLLSNFDTIVLPNIKNINKILSNKNTAMRILNYSQLTEYNYIHISKYIKKDTLNFFKLLTILLNSLKAIEDKYKGMLLKTKYNKKLIKLLNNILKQYKEELQN